MYEVLKNVLETTVYTLEDAEGRIDYAVARGRVTPEEASELLNLAAVHAVEPELTMEQRLAALETKVEAQGAMEAALNELGVETRA